MSKTIKIISAGLLLLVLGAGIFLTFTDINVPTKEVERKLDNERFN